MSSLGLLPMERPIAGYTIREVLGRGATAVVYRATSPGRDESVALKLIAPDAYQEDGGKERYEREARLAAAVVHRGILPVYEVGESEGRSFVAMKLAPGDLAGLLREERRLEPARAVALVSQLASALDAAHAHGLVHRDVKPSNVLLDEDEEEERAYLADFGVARATFSDRDLSTGELVGTVGYASPEQIRGEPVDHRTDVYALGCLLYECLTGRVPYASRDALATLWGHLHHQPPQPSLLVAELPCGLNEVVRCALAKTPEARFGSAGELADAARGALAHRSPTPQAAAPQGLANTHLTIPASSFLGREGELREARLKLEQTRLLTVIGPGGAGKTRFAIELASRAGKGRSSKYAGGVFACFLAALRDPALVLPTIAQTLSVSELAGKSALDALAAKLAGERVLLVLDNAEHLPSAVEQLAQLIAACPSLTLLVTSRERLRVADELAYELPPLGPEEGVALFCERAVCNSSEPIRELCVRLEGLPLAIELAAANMPLLSPEELLARLTERLDLRHAGRDADPRQQTLRATIEWSYDLLALEAQALFARLSVFVGGCSLQAAEAVCDAEPDALESLVDKSLLHHSGDRYWMLETIREFAAERLEGSRDAEERRRRHAEHFAGLVERLEPRLRTSRHLEAVDRLDTEKPNFVRAIEWAIEADPELALDLFGRLKHVWWDRGREGWILAPRVLAAAQERPTTFTPPRAWHGRTASSNRPSSWRNRPSQSTRSWATPTETEPRWCFSGCSTKRSTEMMVERRSSRASCDCKPPATSTGSPTRWGTSATSHYRKETSPLPPAGASSLLRGRASTGSSSSRRWQPATRPSRSSTKRTRAPSRPPALRFDSAREPTCTCGSETRCSSSRRRWLPTSHAARQFCSEPPKRSSRARGWLRPRERSTSRL
jgi:non-specific serine/threonine protein kinase